MSDLKNVPQIATPKGTCCFAVPLQIGVYTIAVLSIALMLVNAFSAPSVFFTGVVVALIFINLIGIYAVYSNNSGAMLFYAICFGIINIVYVGFSVSVVTLATLYLNCKYAVDVNRCENYKRALVAYIIISSIFHLYFVYVVSEYTSKLRRNIREGIRTNVVS